MINSCCTDTNNHDNELLVQYAFGTLIKNPKLVDPRNLETTYEYYLLENLSLGLIRDDFKSLDGFQPGLAAHWYQENKYTWRFKLQKNLRWSDGTAIDPLYLADHFYKLRNERRRHILQLRYLNKSFYDEDQNEIVLEFNHPTTDYLLHELSLADAVLTHPRNDAGNWFVTAGPYYVEKYSPSEKTLILKINKHCPLYSPEAPESVKLFGLNHFNEFSEVFKKIDADLMQISAFSSARYFENIFKNAAHVNEGTYTLIHYFVFNPAHQLAYDVNARREFSYIINKIFENFKHSHVKHENQMVPFGYKGRLQEFKWQKMEITSLKNKELLLQMYPLYKEIGFDLAGFIKDGFTKYGIKVSFVHDDHDFSQPRVFAQTRLFQGNHKHPLSSMNFLFSKKEDHFNSCRHLAQKYFQRFFQSENTDNQGKLINELHEKVLENACFVPFLSERSFIFMSGRTEVSNLNPFDMRPRFYLFRKKLK